MLKRRSKYFETALSTRWSNKSGPEPLAAADPDIFEHYVDWVYSGDVDLSLAPGKEENALAMLYQLADMLLDKALCNFVMDKLVLLAQQKLSLPNLALIELAFGPDTGENENALCRFILDKWLWNPDCAWLRERIDIIPPAFIRRLLFDFAESVRDPSIIKKDWSALPKCTYHEHDDDVPKAASCDTDAPGKQAKKRKR